jgi:hypothetical protein
VCFWCSLKYTHAIDLNFEYVSIYGMDRSVTKIGMILMCRFFNYDLCKLYARLGLMLFVAPLMNISLSTNAP